MFFPSNNEARIVLPVGFVAAVDAVLAVAVLVAEVTHRRHGNMHFSNNNSNHNYNY